MCVSKFSSMTAMLNHVKRRHPENKDNIHEFMPETYAKASGKQCPQCKESFESRPRMFDHYMYMHPEAPIYHCSLCEEKYITLSGLNTHVFKVHERKLSELKCNFCGKDFDNKENVKNTIEGDK